MVSIDRLSHCAPFANLGYFVRGGVYGRFGLCALCRPLVDRFNRRGFSECAMVSSPSVRSTARHRTGFTRCAANTQCSRARPYAPKIATPAALWGCIGGFARRSGHILACGEDASSQNVGVKLTLSEIATQEKFAIRMFFT